MAGLERDLEALESVTNITTFVGRGPGRFAATIQPEQPNSAYSHLLVEVSRVTAMEQAIASTRRIVS